MYFAKAALDGAFGHLRHERAPVAIDEQRVIRMNRDTLYSSGVFDLDAGPVTIALPDTGARFMSLLVVSEDHYTLPVVYAPVSYPSCEQVATRYTFAAIQRSPTLPILPTSRRRTRLRTAFGEAGGQRGF